MKTYKLAQAAQRDIKKIWRYVFAQNGDMDRADLVLTKLYDAFDFLVDYPLAGRPRAKLGGARAHPVGNYVIVYEPADFGIFVLRVSGGEEEMGQRG